MHIFPNSQFPLLCEVRISLGPIQKIKSELLATASTDSTAPQPSRTSLEDPSAQSTSQPSELVPPQSDREKLFGLKQRHAGRKGVDAQIQDELNVHDSVTEELAAMARSLKERFAAANKALEADNRLLETTEQAAIRNAARLAAEKQRLEQQLADTNRTTCIMYIVLLMIVVLFVPTYLLIRFVPPAQ
eukprot:c9940_g1_i2.p1 GENE.c9940_g1_i2~~c9940_g1_i2.p1  ORF type:complete len:188 (+),score=52.00 c9940_g1_i2:419-982(+)